MVVGFMIALVAGLGLWKASDWWSSVNTAKQNIRESSDKARADVQVAVKGATATIEASASEAEKQSESFSGFATKTKDGLSRQSNSLGKDVASTRAQLAGAEKLQEQMNGMQRELQKANDTIRDQQRVISSSGEFVKKIFSSHITEFFSMGNDPSTKFATVPIPKSANSLVYLLLKTSPIKETLQLQYRVFAQQADTFASIHNLVVFNWGEPIANLNNQRLSISYFPDKTDTVVIHSLRIESGRHYADDVPKPLGNPDSDPGFKGNTSGLR